MTQVQEHKREIVLDQDWIWGSVTLPNGSVAIAVLGEVDGRGYYLSLSNKRVTGIVGFRDCNRTRFDGWLDRSPYTKKGIDVNKCYKYLVTFGKNLRHAVIDDVSFDSLF